MPSQPKTHYKFQQAQYEFSAHIRNPELNKIPSDIEERRMKVYRELFYNNIENFCSNSFPILRGLTPDNKWQKLVRGFMSDYHCHSPYFIDISKQFLDYLSEHKESEADDLPFMQELAHWEWMELKAFSNLADILETPHKASGDLLDETLVISPVAWPCAYQYPVHRIGDAYNPSTPPVEPTFLIISRNRQNEVDFMQANPMTYRLLEILQEDNKLTGRQALESLAAEIQYPDVEQLIVGGQQILQDLQQRDVILGTALNN